MLPSFPFFFWSLGLHWWPQLVQKSLIISFFSMFHRSNRSANNKDDWRILRITISLLNERVKGTAAGNNLIRRRRESCTLQSCSSNWDFAHRREKNYRRTEWTTIHEASGRQMTIIDVLLPPLLTERGFGSHTHIRILLHRMMPVFELHYFLQPDSRSWAQVAPGTNSREIYSIVETPFCQEWETRKETR